MRNRYIFTLIISLIYTTIQAQDIPKHTNTLMVAGVNFNQCVMALVDAGYFIDKKDSALGTIVTSPKQNIKVWAGNGNTIIQVRIKDSTAYITGLQNIDVVLNSGMATYDGRSYERIENKGMKGSLYKEAFNRLQEFAQSLGQVSYTIVAQNR